MIVSSLGYYRMETNEFNGFDLFRSYCILVLFEFKLTIVQCPSLVLSLLLPRL